MNTAITASIRAFAAAALLALLAPAALAEGAEAAEPGQSPEVGEVSLLLGKAWRQAPGGSRQAVEQGSAVHARDRITTAANGHVHIRFVDDGLVSVRPNSRLEIADYSWDAENPEQSSVQFNLEEGETRSISGEAGKSARERFRLDTPIAAIGVRGTDFAVNASQENVRARVNEGTIVISPYSADCVSGALGPCAGGLELAGSAMQIAEVSRDQREAVLRPMPEREVQALIAGEREEEEEEEQEEPRTALAKEDVSEVYQESVAINEVNERASSENNAPSPEPEPVVPTSLETAALEERQLVWGRWVGGDAAVEQGISLSWARATDGRDVAVNVGEYGLFRIDDEGTRVQSGLGRVGFELDAAQAFHHGEDGVRAMTVRGGELSIDFQRETFDTSLDMNSALTGDVGFSSSGSLPSDGHFNNRGEDENIIGSVSIDGREAGYFFDKQLDTGQIRGTTLWSSSP